jgi:hypothetical protein
MVAVGTVEPAAVYRKVCDHLYDILAVLLKAAAVPDSAPAPKDDVQTGFVIADQDDREAVADHGIAAAAAVIPNAEPLAACGYAMEHPHASFVHQIQEQ